MIRIGNDLSIHSDTIMSVSIDTMHYMNCSESSIVIKLIDGTTIRRRHGYDIDVYKIKDAIEKAQQ